MVLLLVRDLITGTITHAGLGYAAFCAFRSPADGHTLRLWMLLTLILALTTGPVGATLGYVVPMLAEARCIAIWALLVLEPRAWTVAYDAVCAPALEVAGVAAGQARHSHFVRRSTLWCVRAGFNAVSAAVVAAEAFGALSGRGAVRIRALMSQAAADLEAEALGDRPKTPRVKGE